jgi:hypothetical protein
MSVCGRCRLAYKNWGDTALWVPAVDTTRQTPSERTRPVSQQGGQHRRNPLLLPLPLLPAAPPSTAIAADAGGQRMKRRAAQGVPAVDGDFAAGHKQVDGCRRVGRGAGGRQVQQALAVALCVGSQWVMDRFSDFGTMTTTTAKIDRTCQTYIPDARRVPRQLLLEAVHIRLEGRTH